MWEQEYGHRRCLAEPSPGVPVLHAGGLVVGVLLARLGEPGGALNG